ncbi:hypothetical protein MLD38_002339 [Melastoma candidum]|uniref:Uncharacterized protein n=1 Tax=Melastoma candidum TaxID=119954 RepID=A0ACB9RY70_9MYRT|nr:hypothetical protein MLD38_002339 [Melastoma candidum]
MDKSVATGYKKETIHWKPSGRTLLGALEAVPSNISLRSMSILCGNERNWSTGRGGRGSIHVPAISSTNGKARIHLLSTPLTTSLGCVPTVGGDGENSRCNNYSTSVVG